MCTRSGVAHCTSGSSAIVSFGKARRWSSALAVLEEMPQRRLWPNAVVSLVDVDDGATAANLRWTSALRLQSFVAGWRMVLPQKAGVLGRNQIGKTQTIVILFDFFAIPPHFLSVCHNGRRPGVTRRSLPWAPRSTRGPRSANCSTALAKWLKVGLPAAGSYGGGWGANPELLVFRFRIVQSLDGQPQTETVASLFFGANYIVIVLWQTGGILMGMISSTVEKSIDLLCLVRGPCSLLFMLPLEVETFV